MHMNAPARSASLALATIVVSCAGSPHPEHLGPPIPLHANHCPTRRDLARPIAQEARRCAEEFIARNGYTDRAPSPDTTLLLREAADSGSWSTILRARQNQLSASARSASCYESRGECFVIFEGATDRCVWRALRIPLSWTNISFMPEDMDLHTPINVGGETIVPCDYARDAP